MPANHAADFDAADLPASAKLLKTLVGFDTTSRNSNLDLIDYVSDTLSDAGLSPWLTFDKGKNKANLFATLPAHDGTTTGGVVLSGHTDVVPVDGQDWDTDPFDLTLLDGKLYGRGSADMKGFISVALSKLTRMKASEIRSPIHFAFSFDEEVGCLGAPFMLEEVKKRGINPKGCIIGEPTSMQVVVAHKGINIYRCKVTGKPAHSSFPEQGTNSIEYAARLICFIRDIADAMKADGPLDKYFDTPYSTAQTGRISGGTGTNIIPETCEFDFEFRNLPEISASDIYAQIVDYAKSELLPKMLAENAEVSIDFSKIATAPGLAPDEDAMVVKLVRALTNDPDIRKVAYGTEGGQFQETGIPSVICGPGSIEQAHKANEFVAVDQLARCESFIDNLITRIADGAAQ